MKLYLFILLILASSNVMAHDVSRGTVINHYSTVDKGSLALAMAASGMNASSNTYGTQIILSGGHMDGETAFIGGVAKRFCESCPLLQITGGVVNETVGAGVSFVWNLK